jgi:single-stranded-DNA-specific exonuclease
MKWHIQSRKVPKTLEELQEILLENREVENFDQFFTPPSPLKIELSDVDINPQEVKTAVKLLNQAQEEEQDVLIFGDYDADGISATAILWRVLHNAGLKVRPFIPDRAKHGYGITSETLEEIFTEQKPDLIITVDNGIVAHDAAQYATDQGVPMIITDHHTAEEKTPISVATVHSTKLCGASVAWMLGREFLKSKNETNKILDELDLAGLATIADQVPLQGANRAFAYHGLEALRNTSRAGIKSLLEIANAKQSEIDEYSVNFILAPRINAMGRLAQGMDALRLLCTPNLGQAKSLAMELDRTNQDRKDLTTDAIKAAQAQREEWTNQSIIITADHGYHEGVIGLIAGKLTERYYKPAIAISLGAETSKASARSVSGVNITELIREIKSDLLSAGGHPLAAGFSFETSKLNLITEKLQDLARQTIDPALLEPKLKLTTKIPASLISKEMISLINKFSPFGSKNPKPLFAFKDLKILEATTMGKENNHLRIKIELPDQKYPISAVGWHMGRFTSNLNSGIKINIAGTLELNNWKNRSYLQIKIKDLQPADDF